MAKNAKKQMEISLAVENENATAKVASTKMHEYREHLKKITNGLMDLAKQAGRTDYTRNQLLRECYNLVDVELNTFEGWKEKGAQVRKGQHAGNAGGQVGGIRLEGAGGEGLLHALACGKTVVNRVGLVAVRDNQLVLKFTHGSVNDEGGVLYLGGVEGLGEQRAVPLDEHAVAAVPAASHDEVGGDGLFAVGRLADDNAPAGIGVAVQTGMERDRLINVHTISSVV